MSKVTKEMIEAWKAKYGKVYVQEVDGIEFYFRRLLRPEYTSQVFGMEGTAPQREEKICELTVLYPEGYDFGGPNAPAGIASILSEVILEKSGFSVRSAAKEL